MPHMDTITGM